VVQWLEANVNDVPDSPIRGKLNLSRTPWIAEALRIATDPETKVLTILASTQSGKSLFARLYSIWQIINAPAPFMILQANDPEAKDFFLRYVRPLWKQTPVVQAMLAEGDNDKSTVAELTTGVVTINYSDSGTSIGKSITMPAKERYLETCFALSVLDPTVYGEKTTVIRRQWDNLTD